MKRTAINIGILALFVPVAAFAGTCGNGAAVGNPHCGRGALAPVTQQAGVQASQDTNPPTQLGGVVPDPHNTVLVPTAVPQPQPMQVPSQVPTPTPQATPQQLPQTVASAGNPAGWFYLAPGPRTTSGFISKPMPYSSLSRVRGGLVNPDGSLTQYAISVGWVRLAPVATPALQQQPPQPAAQQVPQQIAQPMQVPQQVPTQTPQATPQQVPQQIAQPMQVPQQVPTPTPQATPQRLPQTPAVQVAVTGFGQLPAGSSIPSGHANALLVHAPDTPRAVTSGGVAEPAAYTLEFIEPGLQSRKVKVYRTGDAAEQLYKDTIPLDQGGFQIIVVGTRNPDYVH
jgi:hypothetical protein